MKKRLSAGILCLVLFLALLPAGTARAGAALSAVTLNLSVDGKAPATGENAVYQVFIDTVQTNAATPGTYTASVTDPGSVIVSVASQTDSADRFTATLDLSAGYDLQLYHYAGGLKQAPATNWSNIGASATAGSDYTINSSVINIHTANGLAWLLYKSYIGIGDLEDMHFYLTADLDMSEYRWTAMGDTPFQGTFDGRGHTITGLLCDTGDSGDYSALFGNIGSNGAVRNTGVTGSFFRSTIAAGAIAGMCAGTMENCWSDAIVHSGVSDRAGMVGVYSQQPFNCCYYGLVDSNSPNVKGATYYLNADGAWTGAANAAEAAQKLELEANDHNRAAGAQYTHWAQGANGPVFHTGDRFSAAVNVTLDGAAVSDSAAVGFSGLCLFDHDNYTLFAEAALKAGTIPAGRYWVCSGFQEISATADWDTAARNRRLCDAELTTAHPTCELAYYSVSLTPGNGIATVTRNGGGPNAYLSGSTASVSAAVREHYTWQHWLAADATTIASATQSNAAIPVTGVTRLTAVASPTPYAITYDLGAGGHADPANPTTYTIESAAIVLTRPTRDLYAFRGWTGTGLAGTSLDVTIPAGSAGVRAYTAVWASKDASLTALSASAGALNEALARDTLRYTINAEANARSTSLTVTPAAGAAAVVRRGGAEVTDLTNLPLNQGANPFEITVTAEDGTTQRVYTLTITQARYSFTADSGGVFITGTNGTLTFRCTGVCELLSGLRVDNLPVPAGQYAVTRAGDGSTVVTLSNAFLQGLASGNHTLTLLYGGDSVSMAFTVAKGTPSPDTGDDFPAARLLLGALLAGLAGAALLLPRRRGRRS